ncbi:anthranilate phosphoribosyltransferase [Stackebrandtia nassauensis]|uniref:Anthranilate phosphoribosyltransferase n=1 Tax=Stackebrandtia nassauensis (strain DSM 44728 / CIP 108903 / NRRL B-16338 / NBRC 102104 / LLR-40K-21) TaxID=446470 RepID=D3Q123_STANL|nr:anthranilate phosphoribosyltransferase [Stackebrandtia nassauensis]ADD43773.1 anthranilate phosphoribosyltransferase [Stackebrandtia nassauensis DSM 44728]
MGDRSWPQILSTLMAGQELAAADTDWALQEIMAGEAADSQLAAFAVLLRAKGETPSELTGLVTAMLANTSRIKLDFDCADVVGTGGDGAHTVNISTMASIVVAGGGVRVVKHGNRAASSKCGSADLLEELGVPLPLGPEEVTRCVTEAGIGFCFAARFHPGMRHAAAPRRDLGVPTAFNFLGPLTNPAQPRAGAIGCADERMAPIMARVLADRGASALVVRGRDGLDELTLAAPTRVWLVANGSVTETEVDAETLGLPRAPVSALRGGDATYNAEAARQVFAGQPGPVRDAVVLNAAAAFASFEGLTTDISADLDGAMRRGIDKAVQSLDSGAAAETLANWITVASAL